MARGRRGDPPALQLAKGNPGKRKSKTEARIAEAERLADLLATAPPENERDPFAPPNFLTDPTAAPALKIWRDYCPELSRTHRLGPLHRLHFAMFCVYMGEWLAACDDIRLKGFYQTVGTVAGGTMERTRPVVAWREIAFKNAMDFAREFGLTPREEYALFREQADAVGKNPGLFGARDRPSPPSAEGAAPAPAEVAPSTGEGGLVGMLDTLDSAPPHARPN